MASVTCRAADAIASGAEHQLQGASPAAHAARPEPVQLRSGKAPERRRRAPAALRHHRWREGSRDAVGIFLYLLAACRGARSLAGASRAQILSAFGSGTLRRCRRLYFKFLGAASLASRSSSFIGGIPVLILFAILLTDRMAGVRITNASTGVIARAGAIAPRPCARASQRNAVADDRSADADRPRLGEASCGGELPFEFCRSS